MANDDWVAEVRRWVDAGLQVTPANSQASEDLDDDALGYEAARPALQAAHWPDTPGLAA